MSGGSAGRERQDQLGDDVRRAARARRVETGEREPSGRRAIGGEHRGAAIGAGVDGDEGMPFERAGQIAFARQVVIEVAREAVVGDEDVRLAAQAPAERRMVAAAGARFDCQ